MIDTRRKFVELARHGMCGNTPFMWTLEEYVEQVTLRYLHPVEVFVTSINADGFRLYWQTSAQVVAMYRQARRTGNRAAHPRKPGCYVPIDEIVVMESPDRHKQRRVASFQGEYTATSNYLRCIVSSHSWGLCKRLGFEAHINGMEAQYTLRNWMGPYAQHLFEVAEAYPDHTIEFTNFPWNMGVWDTRPLVWEVRAY